MSIGKHRDITIKGACEMEKVVNIGLKVELNTELLDAFLNHLHDGSAGSVMEDRPWFDAQIKRAENLDPDRKELSLFIAMEAGFQGASGYTATDYERRA